MKLPEPYLYYADGETYTVDAVREIFADDSRMEKLYTEAQLREALASQADELNQLPEQNTTLDAKLASHEAVMRQALSAICASGLSGTATKKARNAAIKALDDALT